MKNEGPYPASEKPNPTPSATPRRVSAGTGKGQTPEAAGSTSTLSREGLLSSSAASGVLPNTGDVRQGKRGPDTHPIREGAGARVTEVPSGGYSSRNISSSNGIPPAAHLLTRSGERTAVSGCEHSLRPAAAPERRGVVADTPPASLATPRLSWSAWRALRIQSHCLHLEAFINGTITKEAFFSEERAWMELRLWETA